MNKSYFPYSVTTTFSPELEKQILKELAAKYEEYYKLLTVLDWKLSICQNNGEFILRIHKTGFQASISPCIEFVIKGIDCIYGSIPNYDWYEDSWESPYLDTEYYHVKDKVEIY